MKARFSAWAAELAAQIIEGASDAYLAVMGGNTAAQLVTNVPSVTPKQIAISMVMLAGVYAASFLKKFPVPSKMPEPTAPLLPSPSLPSRDTSAPSEPSTPTA